MTAPPTPTSAKPRPVSPHLQIWRWHITMAASIAMRASGFALYAGTLGVVGWLVLLTVGPEVFEPVAALLSTWFGQLVLFGVAASGAYHLAAGVRHLVWDSGRGFEPRTANATAWLSFAFAILAPIALWLLAAI